MEGTKELVKYATTEDINILVYLVKMYDKWWIVYEGQYDDCPRFRESFLTEESAKLYLEAIGMEEI